MSVKAIELTGLGMCFSNPKTGVAVDVEEWENEQAAGLVTIYGDLSEGARPAPGHDCELTFDQILTVLDLLNKDVPYDELIPST